LDIFPSFIPRVKERDGWLLLQCHTKSGCRPNNAAAAAAAEADDAAGRKKKKKMRFLVALSAGIYCKGRMNSTMSEMLI
jgi:hypothetical protein